jgi:hypothetical protein
MKRVIFALLVIAAGSIPALAKYSGGTGEPNDPYRIGRTADLLAMAADTNDYNKSFILTSNINLAPNLPGNKVFTTAVIAPDTDNANYGIFDGVPFTGVFNGKGRKIINLTIDANVAENDFLGLFGNIEHGEVNNIILENVSITGGNYSIYIGGLVGSNSNGSISNCSSTSINIDGFGQIGGLVGSNGGAVSNCSSTGVISGVAFNIGGLAGSNSGGNISYCITTVTVTGGDDSEDLGGLVGYNSSGDINNCHSTGTVIGGENTWILGGLVGYNRLGNISNCYSTCEVNGITEIGGLVGRNWGTITGCHSTGAIAGRVTSDSIGGLVGYNESIVSNCYSAGIITTGYSSQRVGGLMGKNDGDINECHASGAVTGGDDSSSIGGLVGENIGSIGNSYSAGAVTDLNESYYLGGLVGRNIGSISSCSSSGAVAGAYRTGGLVGYNISNNSINACFSTGNITGRNELGGLVGYNHSGLISNCYSTGDVNGIDILGGLVGNNEDDINNCYSTGIVAGSSDNLGGLIGFGVGGVISSSYFLNTSGPDNGIGEPLTEEQMKRQNSFFDWDFNTPVWKIYENRCNPYLAYEKYGGGVGTSEKPYRLWTVADLLAMAANANDYDKHFILMNDIDLNPNLPGRQIFRTAVISPDMNDVDGSYDGSSFKGVFDGYGHKITNLVIDTNGISKWYLGLFGVVEGANISNLGLENANIKGGDSSWYVGSLAASNDSGTISHCYSKNTVVSGKWDLGGLLGNSSGSVSNCFSTGVINGKYRSSYTGGLVGTAGGIISDCFSSTTVNGGNETQFLGGLVGDNYENIRNCYSIGTVAVGTQSSNIGGLVGRSYGPVSNCYSKGSVTGGDGSGYFGGLVGANASGIDNCYSNGNVSSGANSGTFGGLVGGNTPNGSISNCYSTGIVTCGKTRGGLVASSHTRLFSEYQRP